MNIAVTEEFYICLLATSSNQLCLFLLEVDMTDLTVVSILVLANMTERVMSATTAERARQNIFKLEEE